MENLIGELRNNKTKASTKRSRKNGKVLGNIYSKETSSLLFEIGEIELKKELQKKGPHGVITIDIDGKEHKGIIKEIQRQPVTHHIMHIDLEDIQSNKEIITEVPLIFDGEKQIQKNGKVVQKEKSSIKVRCNVENIPKFINVDLTGENFGKSFKVGDIEVSSEISIVDNLDAIIATITNVNTNINESKYDEDNLNNNDKNE